VRAQVSISDSFLVLSVGQIGLLKVEVAETVVVEEAVEL
jgi:hypothetical protein